MKTEKVVIHRISEEKTGYSEIKDPTVVPMPDGTYMMYASVGTSVTQQWMIGRFTAQHPRGPWQELEPVNLKGVDGREVCAPAVVYDAESKLFKMYVQTTCFSADGVIALAVSSDGQNFEGVDRHPAVKEDIKEPKIPVIGLYDVGMSDITLQGREYECMVYSAYRRVGCGDVYMSLKPKTGEGSDTWSTPRMILAQEEVPFHNSPDSPEFEWGIEGAKIVQMSENAYVMIGVCFLDKSRSEIGTRQRVFLAAAASPEGPYLPIHTPIDPTAYPEGTGENGHPDTIDLGDKIGILYQERSGDQRPWHLRYVEVTKQEWLDMAINRLTTQSATKAPKFNM